jgi:hypothetical protein
VTSAGRPRRDGDARPAPASSAAARPDSIAVPDATAPLDGTHRDSVTALHTIREAFTHAHQRVAMWQPAPYPTGSGNP